MARTTEHGNGKPMQQICTKHELIPKNTWGRQPKTEKHDPSDVATWIHPAGTIKRQIEYIMVNQSPQLCTGNARNTRIARIPWAETATCRSTPSNRPTSQERLFPETNARHRRRSRVRPKTPERTTANAWETLREKSNLTQISIKYSTEQNWGQAKNYCAPH